MIAALHRRLGRYRPRACRLGWHEWSRLIFGSLSGDPVSGRRCLACGRVTVAYNEDDDVGLALGRLAGWQCQREDDRDLAQAEDAAATEDA